MKIENPNMSPLSSKPTDSTRRVEKQESPRKAPSLRSGTDKVEMSADARLLARARMELGNAEQTDENAKLASLRAKVQSGDYTVQVHELARKLVAKLYPK